MYLYKYTKFYKFYILPSPIHPNTSIKKREEKKLNLYDSNKKNFEDYQDYTCKNFHEYDTTIKKVE